MNEVFDSLQDKTSADLYLDSAMRSVKDARETLAKSDPDLRIQENVELAHHLQLAHGALLNLRNELKRPRVED
jgi:hypothetical protein